MAARKTETVGAEIHLLLLYGPHGLKRLLQTQSGESLSFTVYFNLTICACFMFLFNVLIRAVD